MKRLVSIFLLFLLITLAAAVSVEARSYRPTYYNTYDYGYQVGIYDGYRDSVHRSYGYTGYTRPSYGYARSYHSSRYYPTRYYGYHPVRAYSYSYYNRGGYYSQRGHYSNPYLYSHGRNYVLPHYYKVRGYY